jgi:cytosine/adenosine deaminase-related metal-dependent hydrolase
MEKATMLSSPRDAGVVYDDASDMESDAGPGARLVLEIALVGGRVIDPESGLDEIADVGIAGGRVTGVGSGLGPAREYVDCTGLVVCPGFIDLHSHAQSLSGARLQVLDGVTTALDLECGVLGVAQWHDRALAEGRPLNFGYAASWAMARATVQGVPSFPAARYETGFAAFQAMAAYPTRRAALSRVERQQVLDLLEHEVADGALAVGAMLGYLPDSDPRELVELAALSARLGSPTVVHSRSSAAVGPVTALDAVTELVTTAERVGSHVHLCHVNSTSSSWLPQIIETIEAARSRGVGITTEVYPYERGSTVVGAAFLTADELAREDRSPSSLTYLPTGESIADAARLEELRATDPGGLVLTTTYDLSDAAEARLFDQALAIPHAAFASDAMPISTTRDARSAWPLSPDALAHPRSAGCFSRVLGKLVRERGLVSLPDAVRRCTLVPAQILGDAVPAMSRKGRLHTGADADITVVDPQGIADRATYRALRPSEGVRHVLVAGTPVVRDGRLLPDARPGRPITRDEEGP